MSSDKRKVAVVGSGVAGLTAAWVLSKDSDVTLYEADSRLGGHADTHSVTDRKGEASPSTRGSSSTTIAPIRHCCDCSQNSMCLRRNPT